MEELSFGREEKKHNYKPVFTVVDRGDQRKFYVRIGVAFINNDQSLTVKLDALPTNQSLYIRDWKSWELERMAHNAERSAAGGAS
jgi:hypothetical protein